MFTVIALPPHNPEHRGRHTPQTGACGCNPCFLVNVCVWRGLKLFKVSYGNRFRKGSYQLGKVNRVAEILKITNNLDKHKHLVPLEISKRILPGFQLSYLPAPGTDISDI